MRIQDGIVSGDDARQAIIETVRSSMESNTITEEDRRYFYEALDFLGKLP
jgi:hypothetical protein